MVSSPGADSDHAFLQGASYDFGMKYVGLFYQRLFPGGLMLINLSVLMACTMISCVTLVSVDDAKRPTTGDTFPLSRGNGSSGSGNGSDDAQDDDVVGSRDHGFGGDRWQDRVPREPMWFINAGSGLRNSNVYPEDNARGFSNWWRGDGAVGELINRIGQGYDLGARWFFVNRPMGTPGNTYVPGASWLTLDDTKRDELPELLTQALLDEFDEPVHVVWFVGSDMSDPRSYPGWTPGRADEFYQLGREGSWEELIGSRVTLGGWISTGASGIGVDNSSPMHKRAHYRRLFEKLGGFPFHLNIYGEAYPLEFGADGRTVRDANGTPVLDQEYIEAMPWIGATSYFVDRWPAFVESDSFPLNTETTRMFIWFDQRLARYGDEDERRALVNQYMDRGLIPITADRVMFQEALARMRPLESSSSGNSPRPGSGLNKSTTIRVYKRGQSSRTTVPDEQLPERYCPRGRGVE